MSGKRADLLFLVTALVITVLLYRVIPYGRLVVYPFALLATWFHEMGHGVTAMLLGGSFESIAVNLDLSGVATHTSPPGIRHGLVALGGLLGPSVAGSALILLGRSRGSVSATLWALGTSMVASLLLLGLASVGMWCIALFGVLIVLIALRTGESFQRLFLHLLGVQTAIGVFDQIDYLFMTSATVGGQTMHSDVSVVADELLFPVTVWSYGLTVATVGMLVYALWVAYRPRAARVAV
jgi:hypothetical protein